MPLTRYEIRNEYSLADPELYRAADKEDPEALLEGVAMAGLVGVLRQLGDLAEFAAEVFHDLHEEVMATAARGHGLMVRVQQLEAEVPSIERAFLSQTNHTSFFLNSGTDWHPNLHTNQNLLTRGDLPRCVMDSYEECRGPPRLFLLDKFDVAGAGACLKRYTDPSFFKAEAASSGIETVGVFREKKFRKAKKKGSRWRNGETPELLPKSHPKLHQLLLEERVENGFSNPARLVKLKRRQLNASVLDPKSGKSYMEKFLGTPSPENKVVREISVAPPALKLTPDGSSDSGLEVVEISAMSPANKSLQGKDNILSSPHAHEVVVKPSMEDFNADVIDRQIVVVSTPTIDGETDEVPATHPGMVIEKELLVDGEGNTEDSVNGDHSDDMTSEVDNYMDALATMESEMDTDNEYRPKNYLGFSNAKNHGTDSDENEEQFKVRPHFSDSPSIENSSVSDDGNSSFKRGRSSFSCSDTLSNLAENAPSDGEAAPKVCTTETCVATIVDIPSDQHHAYREMSGTKPHELIMFNDMQSDEGSNADLGEASCSSSRTDMNPLLQPADPREKWLVVSSVGHALGDRTSESVKFDIESSNVDEIRTYIADTSVVSAVPSQRRGDSLLMGSARSNSLDDLNSEDSNVLSNSSLVSEKKSRDKSLEESLQTDHVDEACTQNLAEAKIGSLQSIISPVENQFPCSALPVEELCSSIMVLPDHLDVNKPHDSVPEVVSSEGLTSMVDTSEVQSPRKQLFSDMKDDVPQVDVPIEQGLPYSEENTNLDHVSTMAESVEISEFNAEVDAVERGAVTFDLSLNHPDDPGCVNHISSGNIVAESAVAVDAPYRIAVDDDNEIVCLSEDLVCSPSQKPVNLEESHSGSDDLHQEGLKSNDAFSAECPIEPEVEREVNQSEVAPTDLDSTQSVSRGYSDHVKLDDIHDYSLAEQPQNSSPVGDFPSISAASEPECHELESESLHQSHLQENEDDAMSSPSCQSTEPIINLEQSLNLHANQVEVECQQADEASSSSYLWSDQMQPLECTDQKTCFDTSDSCQENFPHKPISSEFSPQSTGQEHDGTYTAMNSVVSVLPSLDQRPQTVQISASEMPPLPPLPPMQWRIGKVHHVPQDMQGEFDEQNQHSFPSMPLFIAHEKNHSGFPPLDKVSMPPGDQFIAQEAVEDEKPQYLSEELTNSLVHSTPLSSRWPAWVNNANGQQNSLAFEGMQSSNTFLRLPAICTESPEHELRALGCEVPEAGSNLLSSVPAIEDSASRHDAISSDENLIQPSDQESTETCAETNTHQKLTHNSEGEHGNPPAVAFQPLAKIEEQHQHDLPEGQLAWSSNTLALAPTFEVEKPNGNTVPKIPRPRSPLVDALAAHDKSMLRKVTDRPRPQILPKVEERDSLLEQIRTKSFNLKPALVSRPSIQGPKTNLRVAAILEKANAIRQATAGSDEDDEDSWSE